MRTTSKKLFFLKSSRWLMFLGVILLSINAFAIGEKNSKQGHALGKELFEILVQYKLCASVAECNQKRFIYGENGDRIYLNFYGISDRFLIAKITGYVVENGLKITEGVPISIVFYSGKKERSTWYKKYTGDPILRIEVNN
ncbi:MAG: hypothetical protein IPN27_10795 [Cellvibrionales bacterium]|jgi:hypothetical protein|nr:hypothetical protein [Cellvibrionales bacterium]